MNNFYLGILSLGLVLCLSSCGRIITPAIEIPADNLSVEDILKKDSTREDEKDRNYWTYVHNPKRLNPIAENFTIDGRVWIAAYNPYDGDIHYAIKPSRKQGSGLKITRKLFRGFLVAEIICAQNKRKSIINTCNNCPLQFPVRPRLFQRVSLTGVLAYDIGHSWYELHPIITVKYLNPRVQKRMDRKMQKKLNQ